MIIDFPKSGQHPGLRQLWQEAFADTDAFLDAFFTTGFSPDRCRCITDNKQPVAALYWFDCRWQEQRLAYIYGVATAQSHRGKGLCRRLMADTEQLLRQQGYAGILLVPAKPGLFDFYEAMGYRRFGGIRQWEATAGAPISLTQLSPAQYTAARAHFLPAGSVVQDGPLLAFLSTYARFYGGDGFLVCCADDDGTLMGYELLGDPAAAPGILATLGFQQGIFRMPGQASFAMCRMFRDAPPTYFAFALD